MSISILQFTRPSYQLSVSHPKFPGVPNPFNLGDVSQRGLPQQINSNRQAMPGMPVMHGHLPVQGYLIILFVES